MGRPRLRLGLLALGCAIVAARGETHIHGVPGECRMHTVRVRIPAVSGAAALATETLASEHVQNRWTVRSYELSPDGQALISQRQIGFTVHFAGKTTPFRHDLSRWNPRLFRFHPDSRRVLLWSDKSSSVLLMDVRRLEGNDPWRLAYDPTLGRRVAGPKTDKEVVDPQPFGFEWSPAGDAFFVIERLYYPHDPTRAWETAIVRVGLDGSRKEVVRRAGMIALFSLPTSRFEDGQGVVPGEPPLLIGSADRLEVVRPGRDPELLLEGPQRLLNLTWSPRANEERVLLTEAGATFRGAILGDLRAGRGIAAEPVHPTNDVHTLWFSPKGTFATWATRESVSYRRPGDPARRTETVTCRGGGGEPLEVKGARWHAGERWLAITAGAWLLLHDAERGTTERVARFGQNDALNFVADPSWAGDHLVLTRYEDITAEVPEWANPQAQAFRLKRVGRLRKEQAARQLAARLERFPLVGAASWAARFRTEQRGPGLAPRVLEGTLHWSRGRLARCVTSGPTDLVVVKDGSVFSWDGERTSEVPLGQAPMEVRCLALLLGAQTAWLVDPFEVTHEALPPRESDPARWRITVRLRDTPESPTLPRLVLHDGGGRLAGWTFTEPVGRVSETRITAIEAGPVPDDVFAVPEGK